MSSTSKNKMVRSGFISTLALCLAAGSMLSGCADAVGPKARNVSIPAPKVAEERSKAINENSDPVIYLPLGDDVLMPQ
ncbi:MAG TPA: type II and III secretion system family protein, partial [Alphaproteobacteria bacterium]|nr:type II and III secretion system family protein [Alphaproteobacteria bacterium]